jgi:hypothetical protein
MYFEIGAVYTSMYIIISTIPPYTDTYYELTTNIIIDQLRVLLVDVIDPTKKSAIWNEWIETWSRFPLDGFLQSTKEAIVEQIPIEFRIGLDELDKLLP